MPRLSAENRAMQSQRSGVGYPSPPRALCKDAKRLWREVVTSKPADYWEPGNLPLLKGYVASCVRLVDAEKALDEAGPVQMNHKTGATAPSGEFVVVERLTRQCAMLASKLRLSTQAAYRTDAAKVGERQTMTPLLGGNVVGLRAAK